LRLAALAVVLATLAGSTKVPLYDGIGFPDEPYRYVNQTNAAGPPTTADQTVTVSDVANEYVSVASAESGPQIDIYLSTGSVTFPSGQNSFDLVAVPLAPTVQPAPGTILGNVYSVTIKSPAGQPQFQSAADELYLRLPQGATRQKLTIVYMTPGATWKSLVTTKTGNDIYEVPFEGAGQYAMATGAPPAASAATSSRARQARPKPSSVPAVLGGLSVILIASIVAIRVASRHAESSEGQEEEQDEPDEE
jgi:hypothetical protein